MRGSYIAVILLSLLSGLTSLIGVGLAPAYHRLQEDFKKFYFSDKDKPEPLEDLVFEGAVEDFLNFASSIFWYKE